MEQSIAENKLLRKQAYRQVYYLENKEKLQEYQRNYYLRKKMGLHTNSARDYGAVKLHWKGKKTRGIYFSRVPYIIDWE